MGRWWDEFKQAMGDQARGSMKYGASSSLSHNAAAMRAARNQRLVEEARAREKQRGREPEAAREARRIQEERLRQHPRGEYSANGTFDGKQAYIETGYDAETGRPKLDIYYGGQGKPLGPGHGHVIRYRDTDQIVFWRLPAAEGGGYAVNNR